MSADDEFIDAILAAPDDDAPRLVYADALIERGDPRGELITVQCARARLEREGKRGSAEDFRLWEREDQLRRLELHPETTVIPHTTMSVRRGFADLVVTTPEALRSAWPLLVRQPIRALLLGSVTLDDIRFAAKHPTVREIMIASGRDRDWSRATLTAAMVRASSVHGNADAWTDNPLPHRALFEAIAGLTLTTATTSTFGRAGRLPDLRELTVNDCSALSAQDLGKLEGFARLTKLGMLGVPHDLAPAVLEAAPPASLRALNLARRSGYGDLVITNLAALPQLESLRIDMRLDVDLAPATSLRSLLLDVQPSGGFDAVLTSGIAQNLERLWLRRGANRPKPDDRPPAFPALPRLCELELSSFTVDDAAARALVAQLPDLSSLELRDCTVEDRELLATRWPMLGRRA